MRGVNHFTYNCLFIGLNSFKKYLKAEIVTYKVSTAFNFRDAIKNNYGNLFLRQRYDLLLEPNNKTRLDVQQCPAQGLLFCF